MKTNFFKDQEKIIIKLTDDKIINITGMIGSGKSTLSDTYNRDNYFVFNLDCLADLDKEHETVEMKNVKEKIRKKYKSLNFEENFKDYYDIICEYSNTKEIVIEGGHIFNYLKITDLKGTLIICLPSIFNCWKRSITRHFKKYKVKLKNKEISLKDYVLSNIKIIIRRTRQLKYYKKMNEFLDDLESLIYKINIGIDFDGTITDYHKFEKKYFLKKFGLRLKNPLESSFEKRFDIPRDMVSYYKKNYFDIYFNNVQLRRNAKYTINKLNKQNVNIYIITNRSDLRRPYIENYLKKHGITYNHLYCLDRPNSVSKLDRLKEFNINIMIEDNPYQIESISKEIEVICIDDIYNKNIDNKNIKRVKNWKKVLKIISNFKENK